MAIGDKPNQNLFGTNYNAEEEERKKAELAAQGAIIGSPPIEGQNNELPAYGEILDSRALPFSNEAKFPINERMGEGSIPEESVSNLITNNPFLSTGETPVAAQPPVKNALLEMLERADAREAQGLPRQDAPGIIDAPSGASALVATPSVTPPVETPSGGAQGQTAALDPTSDEAILANRAQREAQFAMQGAPGSAQSNFATRMATGEALTPQEIQDAQSFAASMGTTFDPSTGYSREPFLSQEASRTSTPMPGQSLSQFMRYEDSPEQRTEQFVDDQGRLRRRFTPTAAQLRGEPVGSQPLADQYQSYESEVAKAQARLSERDIRPGETQAQRDTSIQRDQSIVSGQTGGQLSQADLRDLAQASMGDATEGQVARGLQIQQRAGLGQFEPDSTSGLTPSEQLARERFEFDKQQALIGDDTSVDATDRKIATIKQANPNISDEDAAAIASGSVRVVSNPITGETQLLNLTTSESKQITGQSASDVDFDVAVPEETLFSRAGDFTGFVEATKRKAQGITGQVGLDVATEESLGAAQDFETAQNELVRAFRESSRYAASEAAALKKELNISLSPFEDPKSAEAKLRSIDKSLARRYENEVATFRDTSFPPSDRQDARMRAKAIAEFRANLGVPPEGQGSTSSTQGKVPQGVDPKDWAFMTEEQRNLFN